MRLATDSKITLAFVTFIKPNCPKPETNPMLKFVPIEILQLFYKLQHIDPKNTKLLVQEISKHEITRFYILLAIQIGDFISVNNIVNQIAFDFFPYLRRKTKQFGNIVYIKRVTFDVKVPTDVLLKP